MLLIFWKPIRFDCIHRNRIIRVRPCLDEIKLIVYLLEANMFIFFSPSSTDIRHFMEEDYKPAELKWRIFLNNIF